MVGFVIYNSNNDQKQQATNTEADPLKECIEGGVGYERAKIIDDVTKDATVEEYDSIRKCYVQFTGYPVFGPAPVLSLPYDPNDIPSRGLMPMGETLVHSEPGKGGHPGIDFFWDTAEDVRILASMDAWVVGIKDSGEVPGVKDVLTAWDGWGVDYCSIAILNPDLQVGDMIKKGDYIGLARHPGEYLDENKKPNKKFIHWQFGYAYANQGVRDRLCPMTYFDSISTAEIEKIWAENETTPENLANAPDICSNYYKNRDK
ncbi:MAG: hypothetical protein PHH01_00750 [Patescibacteria group bacterium]|nr:hypothetical protein [Patescibacteria group bacterium]